MSMNRINNKNDTGSSHLLTSISQLNQYQSEFPLQYYDSNSRSQYNLKQSSNGFSEQYGKLNDAKPLVDNSTFEVYYNGYASQLKSQSKDCLGIDSTRSNLQDRHNKSLASCASGNSNLSQRRGRSHRQRSRQSSNRQLPSVDQIITPNIEIQASPMLMQKQLINNSNQKMLELMSAQKNTLLQSSTEKHNGQISQQKFQVQMSESSLEPYKPIKTQDYNYMDFIKGSEKQVASPMAEFNNIVTEYQDTNKLSTAYKMTPGYQKIEVPSQNENKIGSSTNHKNDDSQTQEEQHSAKISKFILPGDLQEPQQNSSSNQNDQEPNHEYIECLNQPQMSLSFCKQDKVVSKEWLPNQIKNSNELNHHESNIHDYIEKVSALNYSSFENQRKQINEPFTPTNESPRYSQIIKIMSSDSQFQRPGTLLESGGQSLKKKPKSSSKLKRTVKKQKSKEKQVLQSLGIKSDNNITEPSNESFKSQDLRSPSNSQKMMLNSYGSTAKSGQGHLVFSPNQSSASKGQKLSKSKRKKKKKSRIFDDNYEEGMKQNTIVYEPQMINNFIQIQPEIQQSSSKRSAIKKSKKKSEQKVPRPPILYPSPEGKNGVRKNVELEIQKQSRLLENIIMSPLNRPSHLKYSGITSGRKNHDKVPTELISLNKSSSKKQKPTNQLQIQIQQSYPVTARTGYDFQIPSFEDNYDRVISPSSSAQKKNPQSKFSSKKQTPNKRSNIPSDLVYFSPRNQPQSIQKHVINESEDHNLLLFKSMSEVQVQVQQQVIDVKDPEIINSLYHQEKRGSNSQIHFEKQSLRAKKTQIPQKTNDYSFLENEDTDMRCNVKKMLSSSQRLSGAARVHSRKGSTIAEYIERTNKNIQQMAPPLSLQTALSKPLFTRHKNNSSLFEIPRGNSKIKNKQSITATMQAFQSINGQEQAEANAHSGSKSIQNLMPIQSNVDSPLKFNQKPPVPQPLSRQKQAQSCVLLEQLKVKTKYDQDQTFESLFQADSDHLNTGVNSIVNLASGCGNLSIRSTAPSKAVQTPGSIANRLVDSHEEIGGNTQESSHHRSKNSSEEQFQSLNLQKEKAIVLDPGLEHIVEQEDDLQDPLDLLADNDQEQVLRNLSLNQPQIQQKPPLSYHQSHINSNDSEIMALRRDLLGDNSASSGSKQINISAQRSDQKHQDMENQKIIGSQEIRGVETPVRKPEATYKSSQKLQGSQQLLADRKSRDRLKTQTRNATGGLYQVRKIKSDNNGFLINQMTQPIEQTTLRKKKPQNNNLMVADGKNQVLETSQAQTNSWSQVEGIKRNQQRPQFEKKQSLPVRDCSQLNMRSQKKQLNSNSQNTLILQSRNKKQSVQYQNSIMQSLNTNLPTASTLDLSRANKIPQNKKQILGVSDSGSHMQPILNKNVGSARNNLASVYNLPQSSTNKFTRVGENRNSNKAKAVTSNYVTQNSRRSVNISSVRTAAGPGQQKTPITQKIGGNGGASKAPSSSKQVQGDILLQSEKEKYGDRCPAGYKKLGLLGKGGIALVWLAEVKDHKKSGLPESMVGEKVALKQFPKVRGQHTIDGSAKIEIETLNTLFPLTIKDGCSGERDSDFERSFAIDPELHPGIKSIARLIDQIDEKNDFWLVYEVGSQCLGKYLCDVKGEFYKGERIYNVQHQKFYMALARNPKILGSLIRKIAEVFDVLSRFGIVHSDIKPDNILVQLSPNGCDIDSIKLIDFGSAFQFHNVTQISATTPEYLAPEILSYLEDRNKNSKSNISSALFLREHCQPWSFDVWSLGVILLEIVTGFPVWMSLKCRVSTVDGKSVMGQGIFGAQGREGKKIIVKQQQACKSLKSTLKRYECYGLDQDPNFMDILEKMLDFNPTRRISPLDIVNHPFCQI